MQQFFTLLKKEFQTYFSGMSAYFLIFAYLCASFGGAFYFGAYLAEKNSSLYSLFALQPYILIMLIPAVTMRLWAEEYKMNTAEFLLTLPISTLKIICAKFCFSAAFFVILSIGLLPFVIYTSVWQSLDWLNILSAYVGLWLLIILICSLGCFVSSLSKNLIIAYILNILVLLPAVIMAQSNLIPSYHDFLFAEVGFFNLFYFISFTLLFLFFNFSIIEFRRNLQKNSFVGLSLMGVSAIIANVLVCWGLSLADYKADLTEDKIYSLKTSSKQIIEQIKTPTQIELYVAEDFYNHDYVASHYFEQVVRFLNKYQKASEGMIKFSATKVSAFSDKEKELEELGFNMLKNSTGSKNYLGAVIKNEKHNKQVISQFLPQRQVYLEEDIDRALLKTEFPNLKKNVGIYFDVEQNLEDYDGISSILENEYNIGILSDSTYQIRNTTEAVILFNPKRLSSVFLYALDQYVMRGGKLILFLDRQTTNQFDKINDEQITIMRLLQHWGIDLGGAPFDDAKAVEMLLPSKQLLALNSAYEIRIENENLRVEPLMVKGENILGALISGEFNSYYQSNPFAETPIGELMRSFKSNTDSAKVVIIGDADILDGNNWINESSSNKDGYGIIEKAGNGRFIRNLVDYVTDNNIYLKLPKNETHDNSFSLSEKFKNNINSVDEELLDKIKNQADELAGQIWMMSGYNSENLKQILYMTEQGRTMQALTDEMNGIEYQRAVRYNRQVEHLMIMFIFILPLFESFLAFVLFCFWRWRRRKYIMEVLK